MANIGKLIEEELRAQERTASWLARKLYCDRSNVYKLMKKSSLDCELLLRISKALNHNFFVHYSEEVCQNDIPPT